MVAISLKLAKIMGSVKITFSLKLIFNRFFTTTKYAQIKKNITKIIQNLQHQKMVKKNFREKVYLTDPNYFCWFWGDI